MRLIEWPAVVAAIGLLLQIFSGCSATKPESAPISVPGISGDSADGFTFPRRIGSFVRQGPITFDPGGNPEAKYRAGALGWLDVYYYRTYGHSLNGEYASTKDYVKIFTPNAQLISDGAVSIGPNGRRHRGYRAIFKMRPGSNREIMKSQLLIFQLRDRFVKFRVTYSLAHAERFEQELQNFLDELTWPEHLTRPE